MTLERDAVKILTRLVIGDDPAGRAQVDEHKAAMRVAQQIYDLRTAAGLTQKELARLVGTSQAAISRLEDSDYEGHSMSMLHRIASALDSRLEVRFVPKRPARSAS